MAKGLYMNYQELLVTVMPSVIDTDEEYKRIEEIFNGMFSKELSPDEEKLFSLLAALMEEYEQRTLPPLEESSPRETLRFLMDENGLKQTDLSDIFGSQGVVSEVLSGKREISKNQARKLAQRFRLSIEAFI
jgi:HTH-type transcriptional regulator / antitoxin HigA